MASCASFTSALAKWASACSGCAGLNVVKVSALLRRSAPMMSGYVWPNSASTWRSASRCVRTFSGLLKSVNGVFENGASVANEGRSAVTICGTLLRAHRPARWGSGDGQLILCRGADTYVCSAAAAFIVHRGRYFCRPRAWRGDVATGDTLEGVGRIVGVEGRGGMNGGDTFAQALLELDGDTPADVDAALAAAGHFALAPP